MKWWNVGTFLASFVFLVGCGDGGGSAPAPGSPFQFTVLDPSGNPIAGAQLLNYDPPYSPPLPAAVRPAQASGTTDARGIGVADGYLLGRPAVIGGTNYALLPVPSLQATTYTLQPASKKLVAIGAVTGQPILFSANTLVTISVTSGPSGVLNTYQYTDSSVTLAKVTSVSGLTQGPPQFWKMVGDQFWYSTPSDGIYEFSLTDPANPVQALYLPVPGVNVLFATKGSLLVTADSPNGGGPPHPLKAYTFTPAGQIAEISRTGNFSASDLEFSGDDLLVVGSANTIAPAVTTVNFTDPANPAVKLTGAFPRGDRVFLLGNRLVLTPTDRSARPFSWGLEDLTNPENPVDQPRFTSSAWIASFLSPTIALSYRDVYGGAIQILSGNMTTGFQVSGVAVIPNAGGYGGYGGGSDIPGGSDPYYVLGGTLWKLVSP